MSDEEIVFVKIEWTLPIDEAEILERWLRLRHNQMRASKTKHETSIKRKELIGSLLNIVVDAIDESSNLGPVD